MNIIEAATLRNGIISLSEEEEEQLIAQYEQRKNDLRILKFVPASGAATRMFKSLYAFLAEFDPQCESVEDYVERKNNPKLELFFSRMKDLPFYGVVRRALEEAYPDLDSLSEEKRQLLFVETMLREKGLNLGNKPKGLVPFHRYDDHLATPFEEHLSEAVDYAVSGDTVRVHFTVAREHLEKFQAEAEEIVPRLSVQTGKNFEISYSFQDPKTDTVAVTPENELFREENGRIFFRPGGHGALIGNLNDQNADIIFIKNIDNVVIPKNRALLAKNKKILAGKLIALRDRTFRYLEVLGGDPGEEMLLEIQHFLQKELNAVRSMDFESLGRDDRIQLLREKLDRPVRVCGMVRNEGEPGGGPFWVQHPGGEISLQIVEASQIDHQNYQQSKIAQEATHFNPVDIVCSFRKPGGDKYDLQKYIDPQTSFISSKTKNGKKLKALELPGLWNGGMAFWNTIFVEVPVETFNPVKTVADLLKPSHQVQRG